MKTVYVPVPVSVYVHEDEGIHRFMKKLLDNMNYAKVVDILQLDEAKKLLDGQNGNLCEELKDLEKNFTTKNAQRNIDASKWFVEAQAQGLYPFQESGS